MPEHSVDVVVTSPPYNIGLAYKSYRDTLPRDDYLAWTRQWVEAIRRVLKPEGSFFLNVGASPSNPLLPHQMAIEISNVLTLQNTFHWIKSISVPTPDGATLSTGHFKPINSKRFITDCHEYLFHFTHEGRVELDRLSIGVPYQHKSNINRWKHTSGVDKRCRGNNWFIPYKTIISRANDRPHPATFPVQLAANCIRVHGLEKVQTVLDPFTGLGNTALAACECRISEFTGFDIEREYLDNAGCNLEAAATLSWPVRVEFVEGS